VFRDAHVTSNGIVVIVASWLMVSNADTTGVVFVIVTGLPTVTLMLEPRPYEVWRDPPAATIRLVQAPPFSEAWSLLVKALKRMLPNPPPETAASCPSPRSSLAV
jgi:hypothetical protein